MIKCILIVNNHNDRLTKKLRGLCQPLDTGRLILGVLGGGIIANAII